MLTYAIKRANKFARKHLVRPIDILYKHMVFYDSKMLPVFEELLEYIIKNKGGDQIRIRELKRMVDHCHEVAIDCAHKLAPYKTPKLESLEVKSQVEHRYVVNVPGKIKSVEEWAKITGATIASVQELEKKKVQDTTKPIAPSIHDFSDDDDYNEPGMIN